MKAAISDLAKNITSDPVKALELLRASEQQQRINVNGKSYTVKLVGSTSVPGGAAQAPVSAHPAK